VLDFFPPNGDGKNDFWNIRGLNAQFYKSIQIIIYYRLGKTVGTINDFDSLDWDGRFNGKLQISNSYWYKAEIIDINDHIIKKIGTFSLIRK
jgi:gliding motility-associated-like protein